MFDELQRALEELSAPRPFAVSMPLDDKGYYDRCCPHEECLGLFKVRFDDWESKVRDDEAFCPFCRHAAPTNYWYTTEQQEYIQSAAQAEMQRLVQDAMSESIQKSRPTRLGGLFNLTLSWHYTPGEIPYVVPAQATDALRQEFSCEVCSCKYSSIGASFFCPACGHNSATTAFETTLNTVERTVQSLGTLNDALARSTDPDTARNAVRQILEDQFPRLVGAFERFNESLFEKLPNASSHPRKGAVFQRTLDASDLWRAATGSGYDKFLDSKEFGRLILHFQRRHVLSHRQGIIDQPYLDKSGETAFVIGQRLVIEDRDVLELVELLRKLSAGLRSLVP